MRDFFNIMEVSASALTAQRFRMNIISSNLANSESTRSPEGGPYRRRDVVFASTSMSFKETLSRTMEEGLSGVKVVGVILDPRPFRIVYNPSHPDADERGFVKFPNVNPLEEMVNMISARRSYEANVVVLNATKGMMLKALEILRV